MPPTPHLLDDLRLAGGGGGVGGDPLVVLLRVVVVVLLPAGPEGGLEDAAHRLGAVEAAARPRRRRRRRQQLPLPAAAPPVVGPLGAQDARGEGLRVLEDPHHRPGGGGGCVVGRRRPAHHPAAAAVGGQDGGQRPVLGHDRDLVLHVVGVRVFVCVCVVVGSKRTDLHVVQRLGWPGMRKHLSIITILFQTKVFYIHYLHFLMVAIILHVSLSGYSLIITLII